VTYKTLAVAACVNASVLESTAEDVLKSAWTWPTDKKLPQSMEVIVKFLEFGHRVRLPHTATHCHTVLGSGAL